MAYSNFGSECVCGSNRPVPTINYLQGSSKPSKWFKQSNKEFITRSERFERFEKKPIKTFDEENEQLLDKSAKGIVYLYMAQYPYTFEVELNPTPQSRFEKMAVYDEKKTIRGVETFFVSKTYWLEDGKVQVILDPETVLLQNNCDQAAKLIAKKLNKETPEYRGLFWISFNRLKRPYRVYGVGDKLVVMNLLNGAIFAVDSILEMEPVEDQRFRVEEISLELSSSGNVRKF